jgi:hypothetical protein
MFEPVNTLAIKLLAERGHWRVECRVNGEIEPRTVFGCRQGFEPMLRTLLAADAKVTAVSAGSEKAVGGAEPRITVQMPSGRKLTFVFFGGEDALAEVPEGLGAVLAPGGGS